MAGVALVTGASGFVGSHLCDLLVERGYAVRCLVRESSDLRWLPRSRVEILRGEVTLPATLSAAVRDVDLVFHSAGVVRTGDPAAYERVNVAGTRNLAEAALRAAPRLRRFVLVSSLAAGGPSRPGRPRREEDPDAPNNAYGRSKQRGEDAVEAMGGEMAWTVLRPGAVYGPRDTGFLVLAQLAAGGWRLELGGPVQPVQLIHVADLCRGLVEAAESPRTPGRKYYLTHPELTTWSEVGRRAGEMLGKRTRPLPVPRWLVPWVGRAAGAGARLAGRPNPLPPDRLRDLLAPAWTCDTARAEADWGFKAEVDLGVGLKETMEWYRSMGWL